MTVQRRSTRQRKLVLDAVRYLHNHPTADEIYHEVHRHDEHVSRGTVYRNLSLLSEEGKIQLLKTHGGNRYDDRCDAHAHLICTSCGCVLDVDAPHDVAADERVSRQTGFAHVSHYSFFEGLCPDCQVRARADASSRTTA